MVPHQIYFYEFCLEISSMELKLFIKLEKYSENRRVQGKFIRKIQFLNHIFDIEFSIEAGDMFQSFSPQIFHQPQPLLELFNKYISGLASPSLPFKLYSQEEEDNISRPTKKLKKRNSRGPYRKYTIQEKRGIIDRILKGEALKGIAEETRIPKRNLIRWKHEFLVQKKSPFLNSFSEDEESFCESPSLKERSLTATKESLSQSNIKTGKN